MEEEMEEEVLEGEIVGDEEDGVFESENILVRFLGSANQLDYDPKAYKKKRKAFMMGRKNPYPFWDTKDPRPDDMFLEPLYEQQPWESDKYYQMFLHFASLAPGDRTIKEAWNRYYEGNPPSERPTPNYYQITNHWRWKDRVLELDKSRMAYIQRIWIERDITRRDEDWLHGTELIQKAIDVIQNTPNSKITVNVALKMLSLGVDLRKGAIPELKLDRDEAQEFLASLTDEKRTRIVRVLAAEFVDSG